jgi:hypothetical protein
MAVVWKHKTTKSGCPIEKGRYYIKDLSVEDSSFTLLSLVSNNQKYLIEIILLDENKKSAVKFGKYHIYVLYLK